LAFELRQIENLRVHTFLIPWQSGAQKLAEAIWCSSDRNASWEAWWQLESHPIASYCDHPFHANSQLAQGIGVRGTPTFITSDGRIFAGAQTKEAIEKLLTSPVTNRLSRNPGRQ
jgi:thiol:disulfide interchange protein DsbC